MSQTIILAGATGNLGGKIASELIANGATVKAIVRATSNANKIKTLQEKGIKVFKCDMQNVQELASICQNADCFVSAVAGLGDVIIEQQKLFLDACLQANVKRFIPSDFCSDFINLIFGKNRNLDFRKTFHEHINATNIKATSIFNGAFMELTTGEMPLIMFNKNKVLHWGNANILMDFTHTTDVAKYTANAALDVVAPRYLKIAGQRSSSTQVVELMQKLTGKPHKLFRPGGIGLFNFVIGMAKFFAPGKTELYPAWQGMQYMRDMMEGKIDVTQLDNNRYSNIQWTSLEMHLKNEKGY